MDGSGPVFVVGTRIAMGCVCGDTVGGTGTDVPGITGSGPPIVPGGGGWAILGGGGPLKRLAGGGMGMEA